MDIMTAWHLASNIIMTYTYRRTLPLPTAKVFHSLTVLLISLCSLTMSQRISSAVLWALCFCLLFNVFLSYMYTTVEDRVDGKSIMASSLSRLDDSAVHHTPQSCTDVLDELDHVFDQKRDARAIYSRKKGDRWDFYEPEAVCLSEERFGSHNEQRYMAFHDGTLHCYFEDLRTIVFISNNLP